MPPLTSAYGSDLGTVQDIVNDYTWLQHQVLTNLEGSFLEEGILRNGGGNEGAVAYREAASPFLSEDAEEVAEFAEIPTANLDIGKSHTLVAMKVAKGIEISHEMIHENKLDLVNLGVQSLQNTMVYNSANATVKALNSSPVQSLSVTTAWDQDSAKPIRDLSDAMGMVSDAAPAGARAGQTFGYVPDALVIGRGDLSRLTGHDNVQRLFTGNVASENPSYKGILPQELNGLKIIVSSFIPKGTAYVMQTSVAGFISDTIPLTVTELYAPNGDNGFGGSTMSYRLDVFRKRIIAIDNPKAIVKLTGLGS